MADDTVKITGENITVEKGAQNDKSLDESKAKAKEDNKPKKDSPAETEQVAGLKEIVTQLKSQNELSKQEAERTKFQNDLTSALKSSGDRLNEAQTDQIKALVATLGAGKLADLEDRKEEMAQSKAILAALEGIGDNTKLEKVAMSEWGIMAPGLILATLVGLTIGLVEGLASSFRKWGKWMNKGLVQPVIKALRFFVRGLGNLISKILPAKVLQFFTNFFTRISNFFKTINNQFKAGRQGLLLARNAVGQFTKLGFFGWLGRQVTNIKNMFQTAKDGIQKAFKFLRNGFDKAVKLITKPFKAIGNFFKPIIDAAKKITGTIAPASGSSNTMFQSLANFFKKFRGLAKHFFKFGRVIGQVIGKLAWPIQVIIGAFEFVTGAIQGFKKSERTGTLGKLIDGIWQGVVDLVKFIVLWPLDMTRKVWAWIMEKLGFEDAAENLRSFSFQDLFQNLMDKIKDAFWSVVDWFVELFKNPGDVFKDLVGKGMDLMEKVDKMMRGLVASILPDPDAEGNSLSAWTNWFASQAIPSAVYEYAGLDPYTGDPLKVHSNIKTTAGNTGIEIDTGSKENADADKEARDGNVQNIIAGGDSNSANQTTINIVDGGNNDLTNDELAASRA